MSKQLLITALHSTHTTLPSRPPVPHREYIQSTLPGWQQRNPDVKVVTVMRRNHFPLVKAEYGEPRAALRPLNPPAGDFSLKAGPDTHGPPLCLCCIAAAACSPAPQRRSTPGPHPDAAAAAAALTTATTAEAAGAAAAEQQCDRRQAAQRSRHP